MYLGAIRVTRLLVHFEPTRWFASVLKQRSIIRTLFPMNQTRLLKYGAAVLSWINFMVASSPTCTREAAFYSYKL